MKPQDEDNIFSDLPPQTLGQMMSVIVAQQRMQEMIMELLQLEPVQQALATPEAQEELVEVKAQKVKPSLSAISVTEEKPKETKKPKRRRKRAKKSSKAVVSNGSNVTPESGPAFITNKRGSFVMREG